MSNIVLQYFDNFDKYLNDSRDKKYFYLILFNSTCKLLLHIYIYH